MRKLIPVEIELDDLKVMYKYGFNIEKNVERYLKDVANDIRFYEFKEDMRHDSTHTSNH